MEIGGIFETHRLRGINDLSDCINLCSIPRNYRIQIMTYLRRLSNNWVILVVFILFVLSVPAALYIEEIDTSTFFGLFIPAILGLAGSYAIYRQRQRDRRKSLRQALKAEIGAMPILQNWPPEGEKTIPAIDVLTTTIFEQNSTDLGILSDRELSRIVDFYTRAGHVKEALRYHGEIQIGSKTSAVGGTDINEKDRRKAIMEMIDGLAIRRHLAMIELDLKTGVGEYSEYPFSEGMVLTDNHPIVERNPGILVRYELLRELENESEKYVVTPRGEELFNGGIDVSDLESIEYFLGGLDEWIPRIGGRIIEFVLRYLKRIIGLS